MSSYLMSQATAKQAPQSQPVPGREKDMMRNNAGGFAFKADSFARMERFLILGSEGGTYYVDERDLTKQNVDNLRACIATDGPRAVRLIRDISVAGRAPKNDPALYALALAASYGGDLKTRAAALDVLPEVARIGTHLFTFAAFIDGMRGWGPALRRAVAEWYTSKPTDKLAYQLVKYQQRNGWGHRDLFRLAHPKLNSTLARWVIGADYRDRELSGKEQQIRRFPAPPGPVPALIQAFEVAKTADMSVVVQLIRDFGLTREMIPTEVQKSPAVWEALLEKMPPTAMIRTLGRMGSVGLLAPFSDAAKLVVERLRDRDLLRKARVHPIQCLSALLTYKSGHGQKGSLSWTPVPQVLGALEDAFYAAFDLVQPTGKRFLLGIDVSGSMTSGQVAGVPGLTPNMGAAAMAMLIARTEPKHFIGGFATQFVNLGVTSRDSLPDAMRKCQRDFGGTDCAVAIVHAMANRYAVDAFVVITDGETWAGNTHAPQAIERYRQLSGIDAKLIVINMVANRTSVGDPQDPGSLDIVGFDASVPTLINGFLGAAAPQAEDGGAA